MIHYLNLQAMANDYLEVQTDNHPRRVAKKALVLTREARISALNRWVGSGTRVRLIGNCPNGPPGGLGLATNGAYVSVAEEEKIFQNSTYNYFHTFNIDVNYLDLA